MGKLIWLTGDDLFRLEEELRRLCKHPKFEFVDRLPSGASHDDVIQSALGMSLLGGTKLIVVKDPQFLTQPAAPDSLKCVDILVRDMPIEHAMIIYSTKSVDGRTKLAQALKKGAEIREFVAFKDWEVGKIKEWTQSYAKAVTLDVSDAIVDAMIHTVGNDTGRLAQAIDTLSTYCIGKSEITIRDVEAVVGSKAGSIFRLTEAIRTNHIGIVAEEIDALDRDNEEPIKLIGLLVSTLHVHWGALVLNQEGHSFQEIGSILERHPYVIQKSMPELKKAHTLDGLQNKLLALYKIDIGIKSGELSPDGVFGLIVAALTERAPFLLCKKVLGV